MIFMNGIILKLQVREARKLLASLASTSGFENVAAQLSTVLEDHDERQRKAAEAQKREKIFREEERVQKKACELEGHPGISYNGSVRLVDGLTLGNETVLEVPDCTRCHESLVRLADGTLKGWLDWTQTKEPLHKTMFKNETARALSDGPSCSSALSKSPDRVR